MYGHQGGKVGNQVDWEIGIDMYALLCINRQLRRTCHRAQGILLSAVCWPKWGGNPKWRYRNTIVDSLCCTTETNTALFGNYAPIKKKKKELYIKIQTVSFLHSHVVVIQFSLALSIFKFIYLSLAFYCPLTSNDIS